MFACACMNTQCMYVCMSESLYAYYNPVLIQRINFHDICMPVTSARACMLLRVHLCVCVRVFVVVASGRECVFAHIYLNVRGGIYVYLCMNAHARM